MRSFYFSGLDSDLSGKKLVEAVEDADTIAIEVDANKTDTIYAFTEPAMPGLKGRTGDYSAQVNVETAPAGTLNCSVQWGRVNSAGLEMAASSFTSAQDLSGSTGVRTFTGTAIDLGEWEEGDRFRLGIKLANPSGSFARTVVLGTGVEEVATPFVFVDVYRFGGERPVSASPARRRTFASRRF